MARAADEVEFCFPTKHRSVNELHDQVASQGVEYQVGNGTIYNRGSIRPSRQLRLKQQKSYNSYISLYDPAGTMDMGWEEEVGPTGRFVSSGHIYKSDDRFPVRDANAYSFLLFYETAVQYVPEVKYRWTYLLNSELAYGCSVGEETWRWTIKPSVFGVRLRNVYTQFNDIDTNNKGRFSQKFRLWEPIIVGR